MLPAVDPADVEALTACIEVVVEHAGGDDVKVLVSREDRRLGVELLRERFDVDTAPRPATIELASRIGAYDAILVRSATQVTPELIERAERLKVIGRAGTGVDNVDIPGCDPARHRRRQRARIELVAAAEHTLALMLALCRNVPAGPRLAHRRRWERPSSRRPSCTARRSASSASAASASSSPSAPRASSMDVVAFDKFVSAERFRELGVDGGRGARTKLLGRADVVTLHVPKTPETIDLIDSAAIAKMKDGAAWSTAPAASWSTSTPSRPGQVGQAGRRCARRLPSSPSPSIRSSAARTSSSPRTSAPRPPRRRTAPAW